MATLFPDTPKLTLHDPLGEMLGAGDGIYTYTFDDAVKLAGHACPTVAGAFVMALQACARLFPDETPRRGGIRVTVHGPVDQGANGPFSQVLTLLTGAAAENGFGGLARRHVRRGLLAFGAPDEDGALRVSFERLDTGERVTLGYDASSIVPAATLGEDMQTVLSGEADQAVVERFRDAWRQRVAAIVSDGGRTTVQAMQD